MTASHPERHMGPRCNALVEKGHIGYPCSRPQGHTASPADDPEPCYAVEVPSSLRRWQAWHERQQHPVTTTGDAADAFDPLGKPEDYDPAARLAAVHAQHPAPHESEPDLLVNVLSRHCENIIAHESHIWIPEEVEVYCDGTGLNPEAVAPQYASEGDLMSRPWLVLVDGRVPPATSLAGLDDIYRSASVEHAGAPVEVLYNQFGQVRVRSGEEVGAPVAETHVKASRAFADCGPACWQAQEHTPSDPHCVMAPALVHDGVTGEARVGTKGDVAVESERYREHHGEPTKQRPGDQPLPKPGRQCVQDLIIAEMEESKRVGLERYGSTLQTFNGRRTIKDIAEESRDLHVYLKQAEAEAEADRDTLVDVVAQAIRVADGNHTMSAEALSEVAVDAVMGWVIGNKDRGTPETRVR